MKFTAYGYSCLMAILPEDVASRVRAFSHVIPDSDIFGINDVEHGRPIESHITCKYGIHTSDPEDVESVLVCKDMARAVLRGISAFCNEDYIVLKIDVESEDLFSLNKLVSSKLKCTDTHPVYFPHVTIAYLKHRPGDKFYYHRYFGSFFNGVEVWFDRLKFSTPSGEKEWISLAGGFGEEMLKAARIRRVTRRICNG